MLHVQGPQRSISSRTQIQMSQDMAAQASPTTCLSGSWTSRPRYGLHAHASEKLLIFASLSKQAKYRGISFGWGMPSGGRISGKCWLCFPYLTRVVQYALPCVPHMRNQGNSKHEPEASPHTGAPSEMLRHRMVHYVGISQAPTNALVIACIRPYYHLCL